MSARLGLAALLALAGCASSRPRVVTAGALRFRCDPPDARVILDEDDLGPCALWTTRAVGLTPGAHRLVVRREGYFPTEREVTPTGRRVTVEVRLRRVPE
ncbi:MAG: PEGA domain-containing protein [Polyangiales bacterium]